MANIFSRLKDVPSSFRFLLAVALVALQVANDRWLHLTPEQLNWVSTALIALITSDTLRQIGGGGSGLDLGKILDIIMKGNGNEPKPPTPSPT